MGYVSIHLIDELFDWQIGPHRFSKFSPPILIYPTDSIIIYSTNSKASVRLGQANWQDYTNINLILILTYRKKFCRICGKDERSDAMPRHYSR